MLGECWQLGPLVKLLPRETLILQRLMPRFGRILAALESSPIAPHSRISRLMAGLKRTRAPTLPHRHNTKQLELVIRSWARVTN